MRINNRKLFWGIFFLFAGMVGGIISNPPMPGQIFALGAMAFGAWRIAYSIENAQPQEA